MLEDDPTMEPRQLGMFSEWYIQITWPSGHKERIDGFRNEAHARGWIAHEAKAWIAKARGPRR